MAGAFATREVPLPPDSPAAATRRTMNRELMWLRIREIVMEKQVEHPPWWFVTAVWSGIAGSAAVLAAVVGATAE
jgi:hypothetical protein